LVLIVKILLSTLLGLFAVSCKQSDVSKVSETTTGAEDSSERGACVVYKKDTKIVQATCFIDRTKEGCNESFNLIYEDVAPGKYEKELVLKTNCAVAKQKVSERLSKIGANSADVEKGNCVCSAFVQKKAKQRYCLVARKTEFSTWQAVVQLPLVVDCEVHCEDKDGLAASALASPACSI